MASKVRLAAVVALALAVGGPAVAAPLLLLEGGDRSVVVLDLGPRDRGGDNRRANVYRGVVADGAQPQQVAGERREFDCPGRRERLVATLVPRSGQAPLESLVDSPWRAIAWKSPLDYAAAAVCLDVYNRDRLSSKTDVPSILDSLEQVWKPAPSQPPPQPEREPRRRSILRPF